jgi:nucleotide-binding universal stress UspA family protein
MGRPPSGVDPTLVVGFDRSTASLTALGTAADLGARLNAELRVVHAVDLGDYPIDPDSADWEEQAAVNLEAERRSVSEALADYPFGWSYVAVRSEPAQALVSIADEVDALMIVIGARGNGWRHLLERLSGPSVSQRLINHCHRPVLVVSHHHED